MKRVTVAVIATGLVLATQGYAQEIPVYNVENHCNEVSQLAGGSQMLKQGCFQQEQQNYDALKPVWATLSSETKGHCEQVATIGGGSYMLLKGCIDQEVSASSANDAFTFKR